MKRITSLVLASIIGGVMALGGFWVLQNHNDSNSSIPATFSSTNAKTSIANASFDFSAAAEKAIASVVHISSTESQTTHNERLRGKNPFGSDFFGGMFKDLGMFQPKHGSGSGVIISEDGYIVTNNHVVGFADKIEVTLLDNRKFEAELIGKDPSTDLALLKIKAKNLPSLELANSDKAKVGEWVLAIGNPFDYLTSTVTAGIISAKGRDINIISGDKSIEQFIQTDAAINPGNSGGALVDDQGRLLGINTAIASPTGTFAGYSFSIPINLVMEIVKDIKENGGGTIERASLGLEGFIVDEEIRDHFSLPVDNGYLVQKVQEGSSADIGGVLPFDVILEINSNEVYNLEDILKVVNYSKVGDKVDLLISRDGKLKELSVRLRKKI